MQKKERIMKKINDRIETLLKFMEWDYLTESELNLVESFEKQFLDKGNLTSRQMEILEDINKRLNERDRPFRRQKKSNIMKKTNMIKYTLDPKEVRAAVIEYFKRKVKTRYSYKTDINIVMKDQMANIFVVFDDFNDDVEDDDDNEDFKSEKFPDWNIAGCRTNKKLGKVQENDIRNTDNNNDNYELFKDDDVDNNEDTEEDW